MIAGCGGKSFLGPLDLENLGLPPRPWGFAQFRSANEFGGSDLAFSSRTKMPARIAGRQKPLAGRYRAMENTAGRSGYSTTEARGTPESADPAPERLRDKEIPSSQGVHSTVMGWADGCGSTASSVHPIEFNSSKDFVSPWAKARTSSAASRALSRLPART